MLSFPQSAWWQPQSLIRAFSHLVRGATLQSGGHLCHGLRGDHAFHHSCAHPRSAPFHSREILRNALHYYYQHLRVVCRKHFCEIGATHRG